VDAEDEQIHQEARKIANSITFTDSKMASKTSEQDCANRNIKEEHVGG
jgi:hypothetical protein